MGIWGWVQAIATGWFVLSILVGIAWALGGKRIFRKPPQPPRLVRKDGQPMSEREAEGVRKIIQLDADLRGRGGEK